MTQGYLLGRTLLRLQGPGLAIDSKSLGDLSALACADTTAGRVLWLAGDEAFGIGASSQAAKVAGSYISPITMADQPSCFLAACLNSRKALSGSPAWKKRTPCWRISSPGLFARLATSCSQVRASTSAGGASSLTNS